MFIGEYLCELVYLFYLCPAQMSTIFIRGSITNEISSKQIASIAFIISFLLRRNEEKQSLFEAVQLHASVFDRHIHFVTLIFPIHCIQVAMRT